MDQDTSRSHRLIRFTSDARLDLAGIDSATYQQWGEAQAERYLAYLRETFSHIAHNPRLGAPVEGWPQYRLYTAKFRKSRSAHGHRILYREIEGGIRVIRVLHTAMNWPEYIETDYFEDEA